MANVQISDLTELSGPPAPGDVLVINDISDLTDSADGTTKKIKRRNLIVDSPVTLTDAATIATNADSGKTFRVTLGGNRTLGNPTNAVDGDVLTWEIIQDATGSRTIALDTKFALGTDVSSVVLSTTANKRDFLTVFYNSVTDKFYVRAFVKGY